MKALFDVFLILKSFLWSVLLFLVLAAVCSSLVYHLSPPEAIGEGGGEHKDSRFLVIGRTLKDQGLTVGPLAELRSRFASGEMTCSLLRTKGDKTEFGLVGEDRYKVTDLDAGQQLITLQKDGLSEYHYACGQEGIRPMSRKTFEPPHLLGGVFLAWVIGLVLNWLLAVLNLRGEAKTGVTARGNGREGQGDS